MSSERERSCYAAVFQDQYTEFLELQREVGSALAKLQQLETLLNSLPKPQSQVSPSRNICPTAFQVVDSGLWDTRRVRVSGPLPLLG